MKELPIQFSGAMVRPLLDGIKTQTRRVVTLPKYFSNCHIEVIDGAPLVVNTREPIARRGIGCPYGEQGDCLYVRERWAAGACADSLAPRELHPATWLRDNGGLWFEADGAEPTHAISPRGKWRQGMFMPKWASRIKLENVRVRVERVQDISEDDAIAEGLTPAIVAGQTLWELPNGAKVADPRRAYRALWESLNASRGYGWDVNPYVWVVEFRKVK
jgi:hypothetical protein